MLIKDKEFMILKIEPKENKDKVPYLMIDLADTETGDTFNILSKDMELLKLQPFNKYTVDLNLTSSKYGLKLEIKSIE